MITVLTPTRGLIFTQAQDELERQLATLGEPFTIIRTDDMPLPQSRIQLKKAGLITKAEYFLMLDDDIVLPENGIKTMLETLKTSDIAFCDYPYHYTNNTGVTTFYKWDGQKKPTKDDEIAWSGLGCLMCKREVLEKIDFRLSEYVFRREGGIIKMAIDQNNQVMQNPNKTAGEDVAFFLDARELKYKIRWTGLIAKHLRVEKFVFRLAGGKFQTCHKIKVSDKIERPEV